MMWTRFWSAGRALLMIASLASLMTLATASTLRAQSPTPEGTVITNTALGEGSRVGFGSAIAVILLVISLGPIVTFLTRTMRAERR